ncbi:MAG TPA: polysaccharide biosynthesis/export family protein [Chthoniobacterales bacterium]
MSGIRRTAARVVRRGHPFLPVLTLSCLLLVTLPVHADAVLRKGDTLELKISGVPAAETTSLSGQYTIDNDGFVNLAYIGKIRIGGLPAGVAQSTIEQAYRSRDIFTNPTIIITQQITSRFVNVGGEVKTPNRVGYTPDLTVLGSINAAGGFTAFADERKIRLLRGNDVMIIDVKKIRGNPSLDVPVQPGDRIEVPQSLF